VEDKIEPRQACTTTAPLVLMGDNKTISSLHGDRTHTYQGYDEE
jgi:hypothetical protein